MSHKIRGFIQFHLDRLFSHFYLFTLVAVVCFFANTEIGLALDNTVIPSIEVLEEYNDNVLFSHTDVKEDFITTVHPSLGFTLLSEIAQFETSLESYLSYYSEETDFNDQSYSGQMFLDTQFLERWSFKASGAYIRDTTLESELLETGRIFDRDDRDQFRGELEVGVNITELSSISIGYRYHQVEYNSKNHVDYNVDAIKVGYTRKLKNEVDSIDLYGGYKYNESRIREIDEYNIGAGWRRELTDIYQIRVSGGYRTSKKLTDERDEETSDGVTFDIRLFRKGEIYSANVGYRRDLTNTASGEYVEFDQIYGGVQRNLSLRSSVSIIGRVVLSRNDSDISSDNNRFFQIAPVYSYNVTENSILSLGYRYSQEYDDSLDEDKTADRNVVWIGFRIDFPKKF